LHSSKGWHESQRVLEKKNRLSEKDGFGMNRPSEKDGSLNRLKTRNLRNDQKSKNEVEEGE
jgi:hypothetical protein